MFSSVWNDTNSTFIANRKFGGGAACYLMSGAHAYFYSTRFIYNYASVMGGAIGLTQNCFAFLQRVLVLGCSSNMGGVFVATEKTSIFVEYSNFTENYANSGGILHGLENYQASISIVSSTFDSNGGGDNIIILIVSNF